MVVSAILTKSIIYGLSVFVTGSLTDSVALLDDIVIEKNNN